jgi:hypothetical protein
MLDRYSTTFPKLRLLQADSKCSFVYITVVHILSKTLRHCKHQHKVRSQTDLCDHHVTQTKCSQRTFSQRVTAGADIY